MILDKHTYKKIEKRLYEYDDLKEEIEIEEENIIYGSKNGTCDGGMGNAIAKSTEQRALKLIESNKRNEQDKAWIEVIDEVVGKFKDTEHEKIIDLQYRKQLRIQKILNSLHIEKSTYYDKKNDIIIYTALKAAEKGILKIK